MDELGPAEERAARPVGGDALEQALPRRVVVHEADRARAVADGVDRGDAAYAGVVGRRGNRDPAAEGPADQRDRVGIDLRHRLQEAHGGADVLALVLRHEAAALAVAVAEAAVVEG